MRSSLFLLVVSWALATASAAHAQVKEQQVQLGQTKVYLWSDYTAGKKPFVVFSHGFRGCATQSKFLFEALANAGYMVAAINHRDANCDGKNTSNEQMPYHWTDQTFRDRMQDIAFLLATFKQSSQLDARIDWNHVALSGHSLGGYTAMGLAGGWPTWKVEGVHALLLFSPYVAPFVQQGTLGSLTVPVMYQGGSNDPMTPALRQKDGAFEKTSLPRYYVEFPYAEHYAWTDNSTEISREGIIAYSIAFLDHVLRGKPVSPILNQASNGAILARTDSNSPADKYVPAAAAVPAVPAAGAPGAVVPSTLPVAVPTATPAPVAPAKLPVRTSPSAAIPAPVVPANIPPASFSPGGQ